MIEIEYVVRDKKGAERLRTSDKKAADAYDKALDNADRLAEMLRHDKVLPNLERALKGKDPELSPHDGVSDAPDNVAHLKAAQ